MRDQLLSRLLRFISPRRKVQFGALILLTIISSFAEILSLSAVVPFVAIITEPQKISGNILVGAITDFVGIKTDGDLIVLISIIFMVAAIMAAGLRTFMLWLGIKLSNSIGADLSTAIYRRTLFQPYSCHLSRSSSEVISGVTQKVATTTSILTSIISIITSGILFVAIFIGMLIVSPIVAGIAFSVFGIVYFFIGMTARKRLQKNSHVISKQQTNIVRNLQEGLGAIRDILLDGTQNLYTHIYANNIRKLQAATGDNQFITLAPRYTMEAIGLVLVGIFALALKASPEKLSGAIPVLAALGLGAQRLLPLLQQLYGNITFVKGGIFSLEDTVKLLEQPIPGYANLKYCAPILFEDNIRFEGVGFRYGPQENWVLNELNLKIKKGSMIGVMGSTGAGKSTFIDVLMCLLSPTKGSIFIDGQLLDSQNYRSWQKILAHVPQSIFLADMTIARNIAFGVPESDINFLQLNEAARGAQLEGFVQSLPKGYNTIVGERGVRLSGGQRQRIGIARALYKKAEVLVFDEATSALDVDTEAMVMQSIESMDSKLTVFLITHRISTLKNCDVVLRLEAGNLTPWLI